MKPLSKVTYPSFQSFMLCQVIDKIQISWLGDITMSSIRIEETTTGYNPRNITEVGAVEFKWLTRLLLPMPMTISLGGIVSSGLALIIASNMKSDQASVSTLKYMAVTDIWHSLNIIINMMNQLQCALGTFF